MNPLSEKQLGWLSWWLKSNYWDQLPPALEEDGADRRMVYAEEWIEKNLDRGTASEIIGIAKQGDDEIAWKQLVHLGLPIKKESLNVI